METHKRIQRALGSGTAAALLCWLAVTTSAEAASNVDPNTYAWGENVGWIRWYGDGTNGVVVSSNVLSGYAWGENIGWIYFGDGAPASPPHYSNASAGDTGVNLHQNTGGLEGYAWGENVGWIVFEPSKAAITSSGKVTGYAWGENIGWINLGQTSKSGKEANPGSDEKAVDVFGVQLVDIDGDEIADAFETDTGVYVSPYDTGSSPGVVDTDGDGIADGEEVEAGTDPTEAGSTPMPVFRIWSALTLIALLIAAGLRPRTRRIIRRGVT